MQAIQYLSYGPASVLRMAELPDPEPGPGEVRVRVEAAGVSPIDAKLRAGLLQQHFSLAFPKTPGRDGVGTIDKVGPGVANAQIGERVCMLVPPLGAGTHAQAVVCALSAVVPRPRNVPSAQAAALLQPGVSAWIAMIEVARVEPGMRVLVHGGAGAVGSLMVQLGHHLGAHVTATCRADNLAFVAGLGADAAIAYDREDFAGLRGLDVVFDLIGGSTHDRSYGVLRRGGHLVYLAAEPIVERGAPFGVRVTRARIAPDARVLAAVAELAERGRWQAQVSKLLPLRDAAEAHLAYERGQVTRGRIVLQIGPAGGA
jgi:NADPH:quinone reductase-like Zn-dependent oxidoreductase